MYTAKNAYTQVQTKILIFVFCILYLNKPSLGQNNSEAGKNKEIDKEYLLQTDYSSYINLTLYKNGEFSYTYKFEMILSTYEGKWKQKNNKIILSRIKSNNIPQLNIYTLKKPQKMWFIFDNKLCAKKKDFRKKSVCLVLK